MSNHNKGVIKSKVIANEDAFPIYDKNYNYISFIEHWRNSDDNINNYIIYHDDIVEVYEDENKISEYVNFSGLPIHYAMMDKSEYIQFGDSILNDLIPIMNQIEQLLSKLDDAITTLSLNPIGVSTGNRIVDTIPKEIVGATLNLEDGGDFKYVNAQMDYNNIKLLLDTLMQQLYTVADVPSSVIGQSNIANVSEVSLKLLFSQTDNKAKQTIQVLKEGFFKRLEHIRTLLDKTGKSYSDEQFDSINIEFNVNRPVDTESFMNELKIQREMGAISIESIIDLSPYTNDTPLELQRISKEEVVKSDES